MRMRLTLILFAAGAALLLWSGRAQAAASCYVLSDDVGYVCDTNPPPSPFSQPVMRHDSILPGMKFGKLADNINVYAEPNIGSAIVRNAGDGFLFHTIEDTANNNAEGRLWYMIGPGEWVRGEDIALKSVSDFTGVELRAQPQRPFGWVIVDFAYSDAPGAEPSATAIKVPRYTFIEVYDAEVDEQGWIWYDIGHGRWMRQTYVSIIDVNPRPAEVAPGEYWVEVDLYEQNFAAYEGQRMVYAGLLSSGLNRWPTYEGIFQVWERHMMTNMVGRGGQGRLLRRRRRAAHDVLQRRYRPARGVLARPLRLQAQSRLRQHAPARRRVDLLLVGERAQRPVGLGAHLRPTQLLRPRRRANGVRRPLINDGLGITNVETFLIPNS